jgi:SAM-dependent methyltransferase
MDANDTAETPLDDPKTFFEGLALDLWNAIVPAELTVGEVAFLVEQFKGISGRLPPRLLDIACGSGRHAIGLAKQRFDITGLDIAKTELERLAANAKQAKVQVATVESDLRQLASLFDFTAAGGGGAKPFDGAYVFGNALGYLDTEELAAFLSELGRVVREGGRVVLDTAMVAESFLHRFEDQVAIDGGDVKVVIENEYDVVGSRVVGTYTFEGGGQTVIKRFAHHVVTCRELFELVEEAGFEIEKLLGDLDGSPYEVHDPRLILVARRVSAD